jgi:hypothetical protein
MNDLEDQVLANPKLASESYDLAPLTCVSLSNLDHLSVAQLGHSVAIAPR